MANVGPLEVDYSDWISVIAYCQNNLIPEELPGYQLCRFGLRSPHFEKEGLGNCHANQVCSERANDGRSCRQIEVNRKITSERRHQRPHSPTYCQASPDAVGKEH